MALFKKKNEEVEEEETFEERKITRNLKDLNPENKKKRKEPPKPWGKRERLIILVIFLATVVISAILSISNGLKLSFEKPNFRSPRLDFSSINIFKGETITIEKNK